MTNTTWEPLKGAALLERLRDRGRPRLVVDADFAERLRTDLVRELAGIEVPEPITGRRFASLLACAKHEAEMTTSPSMAMATGVVMDVLFRQFVTSGPTECPMADALDVLQADDRQLDLVAWMRALPASEKQALATEVDRQMAGLVDRWPELQGHWLPRTGEQLRASLGDIECSVRADLAIGRPLGTEASVLLMDVVAGERRPEQRLVRQLFAVLETLRHGAPPFAVATYFLRTGALDLESVTVEYLMEATQRLVRASRVAAGAPRPVPGLIAGASGCGACGQLSTPTGLVAISGQRDVSAPRRPAPSAGDVAQAA